MAFVNDSTDNSQDPNKKSDDQGGQLTGSGGLFGNTPSGGAAASGGSAAGGDLAAKPNKSGSWTNLQSYLDANKDQASQMGQNIAGSVDSEASKARGDLKNTTDQFNQQVQSNTVNADQGLLGQLSTDPTAIASDADKTSAFQKMLSGSYGGPTDLTQDQNYGNVAQEYNAAQNDLSRTGSEAGRKGLLQDTYGKNRTNYNTGEQNLDQMLLQRSPDAQSALGNLSSKYTGFDQDLTSAASKAQEAAKAAQAASAKTAEDTKQALTGAVGGFGTTLSARAAKENADAQAAWSNLNSILQDSGQAPNMPVRNYGVDALSKNGDDYAYFQGSKPGSANMQNVATADEYAKINALQKLANGQVSSDIFGQFADPSKAGSFNAQPLFDRNKYVSAVNNAGKEYQTSKEALDQELAQYRQSLQQMQDQFNDFSSKTDFEKAHMGNYGEVLRDNINQMNQQIAEKQNAMQLLNGRYNITDDPNAPPQVSGVPIGFNKVMSAIAPKGTGSL